MLIPEKMKELEIDCMRIDNKFTEHKRDSEGIETRLKRMEDLQGQSTSSNDKLKRVEHLNG